MRFRITIIAISAFLAAVTIHAAQKRDSANVMMEAAKKKEIIDGDLSAAIKQYEEIVSRFAKTDPAVAADALLHMAEGYQQQGERARAKAVYEQILRDYVGQKEAVAKAQRDIVDVIGIVRTGSSNVPGVTTTEVVMPQGMASSTILRSNVSNDGRFINRTYGRGGLLLHNLRDHAERPLALESAGTSWSSFSRDATQVAYGASPLAARGTPIANRESVDLYVVAVEASGVPQAKRIAELNGSIVVYPFDWTRDGKWISVVRISKDKTRQIGLVSTVNGDFKLLKSIGWRGADSLFMSPDDKYLAFDLPAGDTTAQRDIMVLAMDGSGEQRLVDPADDSVMGWSPDGKYLLFRSDRSPGATGLWAMSFSYGRIEGRPKLVKAAVGPGESYGITQSGALYLDTGVPSQDYIRVQSFNFETEKLMPSSLQEMQGWNRAPSLYPVSSVDGNKLAYLTGESGVITIRDLVRGNVRTLVPQLDSVRLIDWSRDESAFLVAGTDFKGRGGLFRLDAQSAEISPLLIGQECGMCAVSTRAAWSADGKNIYFNRIFPENRGGALSAQERELAVISRDTLTNKETELFRSPAATLNPSDTQFELSPDGRYIAKPVKGEILLIPTAGGAPQKLSPGGSLYLEGGLVAWAPDSLSVLVATGIVSRSAVRSPVSLGLQLSVDSSQLELRRVLLDGSSHRIDAGFPSNLDPGNGGNFSVSRAGRVMLREHIRSEKPFALSVIEHFLSLP